MKIVVKVGTSTLTHVTGCVNIRRIEKLVKVLSDIKNAGNQVILVSSGAIAMGVGKLNLEKRPVDIAGKQAAAAVGRSAALPDNGIGNRLARFTVPHQSGFPLIGDADGGNLRGRHAGFEIGLHHGVILADKQLHGVVFHPARVGIQLRKLNLGLRENVKLTVEHNGPAAGGSLIQCNQIALHTITSSIKYSKYTKIANKIQSI